MKKVFYITLLVLSTILTVTSCTQENVEPANTRNTGGGGLPDTDPLK